MHDFLYKPMLIDVADKPALGWPSLSWMECRVPDDRGEITIEATKRVGGFKRPTDGVNGRMRRALDTNSG